MNFQFEILYFFGPPLKVDISPETEIRNISICLSQSQIHETRVLQKFHIFFKKGKVFRLYQHILIIITFLVQYFKRWDMKIVEFVKQKLRKCLKIVGHLNFSSKSSLTSWPSGLRRQTVFRSFGKNLRWVRGQHFFFIFSKFHLTLNLVFTLFFKQYVSFPLKYEAIFLKMAPLFSYEPTVKG